MNKFIIVEYNYSSSERALKISIINNNEFAVVSNNSYPNECVEYLSKLPLEYDVILDVETGLFNCIIDELCRWGIYTKLIKLNDKAILKLMKDSGGRLSVIGAYTELMHLNYNENLVKQLLCT